MHGHIGLLAFQSSESLLLIIVASWSMNWHKHSSPRKYILIWALSIDKEASFVSYSYKHFFGVGYPFDPFQYGQNLIWHLWSETMWVFLWLHELYCISESLRFRSCQFQAPPPPPTPPNMPSTFLKPDSECGKHQEPSMVWSPGSNY
jgi:hypothetical protein